MRSMRIAKINQITGFLSSSDKRKLTGLTVLQTSLGVLDLMGIAAIGALGALTISGVSGSQPGNRVSAALSFLGIENLSLQAQATWLGAGAGLLLILKTVLSALISRASLRFLGEKSAEISGSLIARLLQSDLATLGAKSKQQHLYACTTGSNALALGILGSISLLVSDISLTLLILAGLLVIDWSLSLATILLFGLVAIIVHKFISQEARKKGTEIAAVTVKSNQEILDSFVNFREIATRGLRYEYSSRLKQTRTSMARTYADLTFLPNVSKYIVELTVVFGGLIIGTLQFLREDSARAVATITLFVAASARIAPAILRIQQSIVGIRVNFAACESTLELDKSLAPFSESQDENIGQRRAFPELAVSVMGVGIKFPNFELKNLDFKIPHSSFVALVGPSGSGKTTLADLLMGILTPTSGSVLFNEHDAKDVAQIYPGIIGYVPQEVHVIRGTLRDNILFGFKDSEFSDDEIWSALGIASLEESFSNSPLGLDLVIGDGHSVLSGGQKQRLGIARAILTKPRLIVLDEATSALDAETEESITQSLEKLRPTTSIVIIAHRLSTVRNADLIIYLEEGEVRAIGTFTELRGQIPNFDNQAKLMGL
jgi:ABC-type multidrug transport system fused ATPase/permease subunit